LEYELRGNSSGKKVLIVDDNHDAAYTLASIIRIKGHVPVVAYDAPSGLEIANWMIPEIIIHDIVMPLMDGYTAAKRLRSDAKFRNTLLVALTGLSGTHDRERSRQAGYDLHMTKPIDFGLLDEILEGAVRKAG
jgi:CheY-like chemotaxis protein